MRDVILGGLRVRVTDGDDGGRLVVLLHGFGAPGDDLVPLADVLDVPPGTRFAFPEAPLELPPPLGMGTSSRAWWMIDFEKLEQVMSGGGARDVKDEVPEGLPGARSLVIAMLEALQKDVGAAPERTVLGGFSQGAMLSCDVVLHTDRPFAGLVLLSGNLLAEAEWTPRMAARAGLPVFQSHGEEDPLLPYRGAKLLNDALVAAGLDAELTTFHGGHEIPPEVVAGTERFLRRVL